jgi:Domain of unknown function (DUF1735)
MMYHKLKISGMKRNKYNMIYKLGLLFSLITFAGSSCVKTDTATNTDFSNLGPTIILPEGGLQNFSSQVILFPGVDSVDTAFFHINYASKQLAPSDQVVNFAYDPAALAAYNATITSAIDTFAVFPDSTFKFTATSATVPKGSNYSPAIPFTLFPDKIDPTKNYMFPITITTIPTGPTLSSNFRTIYYHTIGNPIAGLYNSEWRRWNAPNAPPGVPNFDVPSTSTFSPDNATQIEVPSGTGTVYVLTFDNNAGVLSNFQVSFLAGSTAGITITGGPTIITADPITGTYEFTFGYLNGSGAARTIDDKFTK